MKIIITETQKEEILSNLNGGYDKDIMIYLRRNYPISKMEVKEFPSLSGNRIFIDDRTYPIEDNKKRLVNIILYEIVDIFFQDKGIPMIRKTIKKYLDEAKNI